MRKEIDSESMNTRIGVQLRSKSSLQVPKTAIIKKGDEKKPKYQKPELGHPPPRSRQEEEQS